jgi:hypothetical protein
MVSRPTSITVIAWFLIGMGFLGALGTLGWLVFPKVHTREIVDQNPTPVPITYGMAIAGIAVDLICGYFMLRGRHWTRYMYVSWSALRLAVFLPASLNKLFMIPSALIFIAITIFLFAPAANAFFAAGEQNIDPRGVPSTRRMIGMLFYFLAGFFFTCMGPMALTSVGGGIVKTMMICFFLLPFAICLSIGRWLSAQEHWKREVGIVILLSWLPALAMVTMMATVFANPRFNPRLRPEHADLMGDYWFAAVWFGAWLLLGCGLLFVSRNDSRQPSIPRPLARRR